MAEAVAVGLRQGWVVVKGPQYRPSSHGAGAAAATDADAGPGPGPRAPPTSASVQDGGQEFAQPGWTQAQRVCRHCPPPSRRQALRNAVYADLWSKGYHVSLGTKFGGDFLAYAGARVCGVCVCVCACVCVCVCVCVW